MQQRNTKWRCSRGMSSVHRTVCGELITCFFSPIFQRWQWARNRGGKPTYSKATFDTRKEAMEAAMEALRSG
jgi:hypothetical protein